MSKEVEQPQNIIQADRRTHFEDHPQWYTNFSRELVVPEEGNLRFGTLLNSLRRFPRGFREEDIQPSKGPYIVEPIAQDGLRAYDLIARMNYLSTGSYSEIEADTSLPDDGDMFITNFSKVLNLSPEKQQLLRIVYVYNLVLRSFEERNVPNIDDINILGMFWSNPTDIIEQYNSIVGPVIRADAEVVSQKAEQVAHRESVRRRGQVVAGFTEIADVTGEDLLRWMYELGYNDVEAADELQALLAERGVVDPPSYGENQMKRLRNAFGIQVSPQRPSAPRQRIPTSQRERGAYITPIFRQQRELYQGVASRIDEFGLSSNEKAALQMRFEQGLSLEQIGRQLRVTREAVRQMQERGLQKIESRVQDQDREE